MKILSLPHRLFRRAFRVALEAFSPTPPQRHKNAYATLLPVIAALSTHFEIRRVVEFGCGYNSTLTFLRRDIFPVLDELTSIENNEEWAKQIREQTADSRLRLERVNGLIANAVTRQLLSGADLILIDDSTCAVDRSRTIAAVAECAPPDALVVIHDFEVAKYRQAAESWPHVRIAEALLPQTAVLSRTVRLTQSQWKQINRNIARLASTIDITDVVGWREAFISTRTK